MLIVGGRQSAYEWAALIAEHEAERIDIVHRHDVPRFERVSWKFVDDNIDATLAVRGWWRKLPQSEQQKIARRFWEVGRIVFATGYAADMAKVPYLAGIIDDVDLSDGFPTLDETFQPRVPGLYIPGFAAARDFGPFFGFTKACPAAATIIVDDVLQRT